METIKVSTSQHIDIEYPVAGLGDRIAARLIDLAIFVGLYIIGLILLITLAFAGSPDSSGILAMTCVGLYLAAYVFYNLVTEIFMDGQSVGKRLMKIKVISLDGGQASIRQYLIRWVFRAIDFLFTSQIGGLICVAVSEKKQRIGDIVAGTTVVRTKPTNSYDQIAFQPTEESYVPTFPTVHELSDQEMELVHEVLSTYYKTGHPDIVYAMAQKISERLDIKAPEGMNDLVFLKTIVQDYTHLTSGVSPF